MSPPTSIDGTDITGATVDGTDVQQITVDGDVVFSAGPAIIDDFEDGNLNEYQGDVSDFSITSSSTISGSNSLKAVNIEGNAGGREKYIHSTSGLANYPSAGDSFSFKKRIDGAINSQSGMVFGVQASENDNYFVKIRTGSNGSIDINKDVSTSSLGSNLARSSMNINTNDTLRCEIDWGSNGLISVELYNDDTNTFIGSASTTDSDYTSGGIGWLTKKRSTSGTSPEPIFFDDAVFL